MYHKYVGKFVNKGALSWGLNVDIEHVHVSTGSHL